MARNASHVRPVRLNLLEPMGQYAWRGLLIFLGALSMLRSNRVVLHRHSSFLSQGGFCFYCLSPMWENNPSTYARTHQLSLKQTKWFQCTAEHLKAKKDGGGDDPSNIVAACLRCNLLRHRRKRDLTPNQFRQLIHKRLRNGSFMVTSSID